MREERHPQPSPPVSPLSGHPPGEVMLPVTQSTFGLDEELVLSGNAEVEGAAGGGRQRDGEGWLPTPEMPGAATARRGGHGNDRPQTTSGHILPGPAGLCCGTDEECWELSEPEIRERALPRQAALGKSSCAERNREPASGAAQCRPGGGAGAKVSYRQGAQLQWAFPEATRRSC